MLMRILRFPVFVVMWLVAFFGIFFVVGVTTIGAWLEVFLRPFGYQDRRHGVPIALGVVVFTALIIVIPVVFGTRLLGWPGAVIGPLLMLGVLAVVGRW